MSYMRNKILFSYVIWLSIKIENNYILKIIYKKSIDLNNYNWKYLYPLFERQSLPYLQKQNLFIKQWSILITMWVNNKKQAQS